ncbi:MAG TPA: KH domain-containing protein [Gaiellaceae bacterium]|nr:KH domain-containing protein [Gaiellaceae bacterium]
MEELLEEIARGLVEKPDEVSVRRVERDGAVVFELRVAPDEVGKVIGRQGRIARALRTVVRAGGMRRGERALLEIVEE